MRLGDSVTLSILLFGGLWAVCGLIAMAIVKNKGGGGCGGFALGFLLGPIGVIVALLMPYKPAGEG